MDLVYCWYWQACWDFPQSDCNVKVTAKAGSTVLPRDVEISCILFVSGKPGFKKANVLIYRDH